MSDEPKSQDDVTPARAEQGGSGQEDRSPARSKDKERDEKDQQKQPADKTDEIDGAQADEDTYD